MHNVPFGEEKIRQEEEEEEVKLAGPKRSALWTGNVSFLDGEEEREH